MTNAHPNVRGPGTIQVVIRLCPYDVPSADDREIAAGAIQPLTEDGVPIVTARGEIVGRVSELREEDGWAIAEGFLREDLLSDLDRTSLWRGDVLPISFAVREVIPSPNDTPSGKPWRVQTGRLTEVRVTDADVTVWEGTGMRALHPKLDTDPEPPVKGESRNVAQSIDDAAIKAAVMSLDSALRPLRDALEEWARVMAPAVQAAAQALVEISRNIQKPEPMIIKVAAVDADFLEEQAAPISRYTCTCDGMPIAHVVFTGREGWTDRQRRAEYAVTPPPVERPGVEADHLLEGDDEVSTPLQDTSVTEDEAGLRIEGRLPGC
jgi:hypothetical protein